MWCTKLCCAKGYRPASELAVCRPPAASASWCGAMLQRLDGLDRLTEHDNYTSSYQQLNAPLPSRGDDRRPAFR